MGARKPKDRSASRICPKCKSGRAVPIVYGYASAPMFEAQKQGKIVLGGCVISGDDPHWQCPGRGWHRAAK